jgi:hypothetical protein
MSGGCACKLHFSISVSRLVTHCTRNTQATFTVTHPSVSSARNIGWIHNGSWRNELPKFACGWFLLCLNYSPFSPTRSLKIYSCGPRHMYGRSDLITALKQPPFYPILCQLNPDHTCLPIYLIKVKVKFNLKQVLKAQRVSRVPFYSFFNLDARWVVGG